jgi:lipoprotein-releasing system permease protein
VNVSLFIAGRYFVSRRKKNFIHIISLLGMVGVAICTAALIIVLSVFNGLGDLLRSLHSAFDPPIKIEAARGKSFLVDDALLKKVASVPGVDLVTEVIQDYAYVRYRDADMVAILRGVSDSFLDQKRLDASIVRGTLELSRGDSVPCAIIGTGVQEQLTVDVEEPVAALQVFYIKSLSAGSITDPSRLYTRQTILPVGVFAIEQQFNDQYIFVPLSFMQQLLQYGNRRTSLEIKLKANAPVAATQARLKQALGPGYRVLTNEEQHEDIYRILKMEKLFMFLALSLLILVGSINIFFSLMMLTIDKRKDISILAALGASQGAISRIFLAEGALISFTGALLGLAAGGLLCWLQAQFGLVGMGMESALVTAYPVKMQLSDFLITGILLVLTTLLISVYPAQKAAQNTALRSL